MQGHDDNGHDMLNFGQERDICEFCACRLRSFPFLCFLLKVSCFISNRAKTKPGFFHIYPTSPTRPDHRTAPNASFREKKRKEKNRIKKKKEKEAPLS